MLLSPRYDGPTILTIDAPPRDVLEPVVRQRRRLADVLAGLSDEQWAAPSRCAGWSVRDVVAHLVSVNGFWQFSVASARGGAPTRLLGGFDPAASPPLLVDQMSALSPAQVLEQFVATSEGFLGEIADLDDAGWEAIAEAPAGHIAIRVLAQHALWDCWIHERDIVLPLGIDPVVCDDEVDACLRFAASISPALGLGLGCDVRGSFAVAATDPDVRFVLDVDDTVTLARGAADGRPCLHGDAVELVEALTLRAPMPSSAPHEWTDLLAGLATAFDSPI